MKKQLQILSSFLVIGFMMLATAAIAVPPPTNPPTTGGGTTQCTASSGGTQSVAFDPQYNPYNTQECGTNTTGDCINPKTQQPYPCNDADAIRFTTIVMQYVEEEYPTSIEVLTRIKDVQTGQVILTNLRTLTGNEIYEEVDGLEYEGDRRTWTVVELPWGHLPTNMGGELVFEEVSYIMEYEITANYCDRNGCTSLSSSNTELLEITVEENATTGQEYFVANYSEYTNTNTSSNPTLLVDNFVVHPNPTQTGRIAISYTMNPNVNQMRVTYYLRDSYGRLLRTKTFYENQGDDIIINFDLSLHSGTTFYYQVVFQDPSSNYDVVNHAGQMLYQP